MSSGLIEVVEERKVITKQMLQDKIEELTREIRYDDIIKQLISDSSRIDEFFNRIITQNYVDNANILHAHNLLTELERLKKQLKLFEQGATLSEDKDGIFQYSAVSDFEQTELNLKITPSMHMSQMTRVWLGKELKDILKDKNAVDLVIRVFNTKAENQKIDSVLLDVDNFSYKNPFNFNVNVRVGTRPKGRAGEFTQLNIGFESNEFELYAQEDTPKLVNLVSTLTAETSIERPIPCDTKFGEILLHELIQGNFIDVKLKEAIEKKFKKEDFIYSTPNNSMLSDDKWFTPTIKSSHPLYHSLKTNRVLQKIILDKFGVDIKETLTESGVTFPISLFAFIAKMYHDDECTHHTVTPSREAVLRLYRADGMDFLDGLENVDIDDKIMAVKFVFYHMPADEVKAQSLNLGEAILQE